MASVVSVAVYSERPWSNGRVKRRYTVTIEDNDGQQITSIVGPTKVLASDNGQAIADAYLNRLQAAEAEDIENASDNALNPRFATAKRIAKKAIRYMMRHNDPEIVLMLEPLIIHLRTNYTNTQLRNFLDLTTAQAQRMNRRINAVLSDTGTVKDNLAAFKAEQEDIE